MYVYSKSKKSMRKTFINGVFIVFTPISDGYKLFLMEVLTIYAGSLILDQFSN